MNNKKKNTNRSIKKVEKRDFEKTENGKNTYYPLGGSVAVLLWLHDAILVGLVGLVMSCPESFFITAHQS